MPWPRFSDRNLLIAVFGSRRHFLRPVFPVTVLNAKGNRRSQRLTPTNSRADLHFVLFNEHSAAPTVTLLAAPKIVVDFTDIDRKSRRHPINDHGQTGSVGFTRSKITRHAGILLYSVLPG